MNLTHAKIRGGGGVALHLASTGPEAAQPILFVHGFLHSFLSWSKQFGGQLGREFRLHALDMRGHGMSEKPDTTECYRDGALWADDLAAAIAACGRPPLVVVWSYPGLMLGDYLRRFTGKAVAGIVLVAALTGIGNRRPPTRATTPSPLFSADLGTALPALRRFVERCTEAPVPDAEFASMTAQAAMVPRAARLGMNMRQEDFLPDYAHTTRPALLIHGDRDAVVPADESESAAEAIPGARFSLYEGIGHMPFYEAPDRFDAEIAAFARSLSGGPT